MVGTTLQTAALNDATRLLDQATFYLVGIFSFNVGNLPQSRLKKLFLAMFVRRGVGERLNSTRLSSMDSTRKYKP